ncbi:MAG: hypothetical protein KY432_03005, partial [Acidobacteria bacterium]|nr:hypothetical protein [Acidobacteriota bacterium]
MSPVFGRALIGGAFRSGFDPAGGDQQPGHRPPRPPGATEVAADPREGEERERQRQRRRRAPLPRHPVAPAGMEEDQRRECVDHPQAG